MSRWLIGLVFLCGCGVKPAPEPEAKPEPPAEPAAKPEPKPELPVERAPKPEPKPELPVEQPAIPKPKPKPELPKEFTTASGLRITELRIGTGAVPTRNDRVRVHYVGRLMNGRKFDSSYDRGQPTEFGVTSVIKGWTEALTTMKVGGKRRLIIPPDLAYGAEGYRGVIPRNATLLFEVELLDIVP